MAAPHEVMGNQAAAGLAAGGKPARAYLREVMTGQIGLEDVPEKLRGLVSGMMLSPIYRLACKVLESTSREGRAYALDQLPAGIRDLVREEAKKIFERRRTANKIPA